MSNNNTQRIILPNASQLPHVPGAPAPESRAAMLRDCLDSMEQDCKPSTDIHDVIKEKGLDARRAVIQRIRPLLSNPALVINPDSMANLYKLVGEAYGAEFVRWSQEDLFIMVTMLHTDMLMYKVKEQLGL